MSKDDTMCKTPYEQMRDLADIFRGMEKHILQLQAKVARQESDIERLKEKIEVKRKRMVKCGVRLN